MLRFPNIWIVAHCYFLRVCRAHQCICFFQASISILSYLLPSKLGHSNVCDVPLLGDAHSDTEMKQLCVGADVDKVLVQSTFPC